MAAGNAAGLDGGAAAVRHAEFVEAAAAAAPPKTAFQVATSKLLLHSARTSV